MSKSPNIPAIDAATNIVLTAVSNGANIKALNGIKTTIVELGWSGDLYEPIIAPLKDLIRSILIQHNVDTPINLVIDEFILNAIDSSSVSASDPCAFEVAEAILAAKHLAGEVPECKPAGCALTTKPSEDAWFHRRQQTTNWGDALKHLKLGNVVTNQNWNGSGLTVHLQVPDEYSKMTLPYFYLEYPTDHKVTPGARVPWVPSVTDNLSEGWILL